MTQNLISLIISICFVFLILIVVIFYANNKQLLKFNKIILEGNNHISTDSFFELICLNKEKPKSLKLTLE